MKCKKIPIDRDFEDTLISTTKPETIEIMAAYFTRLLPYLSSRAISTLTHKITDARNLENHTIDTSYWG